MDAEIEGDDHPTAFISYAQSDPDWGDGETDEWKTTVLEFAMLLCEMGIDADVDQFHTHDLEVDWNRFGATAAREKDFVLIAVSRAYMDRWEGRNESTDGAGAVREANELMGQFDRDQDIFRRRVKIIVLPGATVGDIPAELTNLQRFELHEISRGAAIDLYRTLTQQPATPKPEVGPVLVLESETDRLAETHEMTELHQDLERIQANLASVPEADRIQAELGHLSLPWVRTIRQVMDQEQAILARMAELDRLEQGCPAKQPPEPDPLERLVEEALSAAGLDPHDDVIAELARRLRDPATGPEELLLLSHGLPGRRIDIGAQKRVKYDLHKHGVLARNPDGRGYVVGTLP